MIHSKTRIVSAVLTAGLALGACSFSGTVAQHTVDYNLTMERVNNEILLLNILRAKERRPMVFSRIAQIKGNFSVQADADLRADPRS